MANAEATTDARPVPGTTSATFSKDVPWYSNKPPHIPDDMRSLLENYSRIPPDEIEQHVIDIVR